MQARHLDGPTLQRRAKKIAEKTTNGVDLWSIKPQKRLSM